MSHVLRKEKSSKECVKCQHIDWNIALFSPLTLTGIMNLMLNSLCLVLLNIIFLHEIKTEPSTEAWLWLEIRVHDKYCWMCKKVHGTELYSYLCGSPFYLLRWLFTPLLCSYLTKNKNKSKRKIPFSQTFSVFTVPGMNLEQSQKNATGCLKPLKWKIHFP